MSDTTLDRRVQWWEDIRAVIHPVSRRASVHSVGMHRPDREVNFSRPRSVRVVLALRPGPPEPYESFDETTCCTDKPARMVCVIDNESEDQ